jgi:BlaI family penicillinase repressor
METTLPDREMEIMGVLWDRGPSTALEVQHRLPDDLAYTTVSTILRILEDKGYVLHTPEGRTHRYVALLPRAAVERGTVRRMLHRVFRGSPSLLLTHLVDAEELSAEELRRMRELLEERSRDATKRGRPRRRRRSVP